MINHRPVRRLLEAVVVVIVIGAESIAAMHTDSQNLLMLKVTQVPSTAAGHTAWQFGVAPINAGQEIGSIDAASSGNGFSGESFRQVHPAGQPTVFSDFNFAFGEGEDATTDTQFTFLRSSLIVVGGSALESDSQLEATFTGFEPIQGDMDPVTFAQVVTPVTGGGTLQIEFAVRPLGGGIPQNATIGPIAFAPTPGDYNGDCVVDAADYVVWRTSLTNQTPLLNEIASIGQVDQEDYLAWKANFGATGPPNGGSVAASSIPEPETLSLMCAAVITLLVRRWHFQERGCRQHPDGPKIWPNNELERSKVRRFQAAGNPSGRRDFP